MRRIKRKARPGTTYFGASSVNNARPPRYPQSVDCSHKFLPVAQRWGGGPPPQAVVEGRQRRVKSPSVSAAPVAQSILSACKAVEGRCHLPMPAAQGGV